MNRYAAPTVWIATVSTLNLIRNVAFSGVSECETSFIIFSFVQRYRRSQSQHLLRDSSSRGLRDAPSRTERPCARNEAPSRDRQMERNLLVCIEAVQQHLHVSHVVRRVGAHRAAAQARSRQSREPRR